MVPAAVRHSTDNLDGYFLCSAVYVSQPQEAYTHFYYQSPQLGEVAAAAAPLGLDKVACACFILIMLDGPTLLCLETGEEGGGRESADGLPHSSGGLPSALSSCSIPYCKCPRLEHDP